jgi:tetratricopeptide (TPR) repeat protein
VLLGRTSVLERADALLDGLRDGRGGLLWVRGDAGIGKTTLLTEIGRRARDRGATVLRGAAADESAGAPAFWPWTQVLRHAAAGDPQSLVALGGARARQAAGLVADAHPAVDDEPRANRFPLFDGVQAVLDGLAAEFPVVVLLDDLHWADEGSLHLLRFLTSGLADRPLLVVGAWRDHEVAPGSDRATLAGEIAAAGESWPLAGLGADDVVALVAATGGRRIDADEATTVASRTGGNPLFVSEMARLAAARGAAVSAMVPDTAQGTIRRRVARLPQPAQRALTVAAVLGPGAGLEAMGGLAGLSGADLTDAVDALVASGLARQEGDRLVLSHALVRDAVYDATPAASRRELHLAAADAPGLLPAEVAGHLVRALPLSDRDRVVDAVEHAARAAREAYAWEDAARLYRQALDLVPAGDPGRARLLRGAGAALLDAGDLEGARVLYKEAADQARRSSDAVALAEAALGFAAGLGGFEVRLFDREQNDLLAEALAALGDDAPALRVHLMARLAGGLAFTEESGRIPALADEAVALARATGDARALGAALAAHCDAFAGPDHVDLREAEAAEVVAVARQLRDPALELLGLRLRVIARWERGALLDADADVRAFGALADRLGQPLYSFYVPLWRGLAAHVVGDLATMARCADEVGSMAGPADSRNAAALAIVQRAWTLIERGSTVASMRMVTAAFGEHAEIAPDGGNFVALYHGQDPATRARALPHVPRLLAELPRDKEWLPNLFGVTEGLLEGDVRGEPARLVYDELAPYGHLFLVDGIGAGFMGSVERPLGVLAMLAGDHDAAEAHFERALVANAGVGAPLALANTRRQYAELLRRRDAPGDAVRRDEQARLAEAFYRDAGILERLAGGEASIAPSQTAATWRRTGAGWSVTYLARTADVPPVKGMADLARLLSRPGEEVHVLDLVGPTAGAAPVQGDLGEVLDDRARAAYRQRLTDLDERIADAEADRDDDALARATEERDFLVAELTGAYGLGGRPRKAGDPAERARTTVTSRIRDAVSRVERVHPDLGRHLRASVRTGTFCSYSPERLQAWEVVSDVGPTS